MAEGNSSDDVLDWLSAAKFIAEKAQDVHIDEEGIKKLASHVMVWCANTIKSEETTELSESFACKFLRKYEVYPLKDDPRIADWLFVLHTLNFSLWYPKGSKQWTVNGEHGFLGLCNAIKRIIDRKMRIWVPNCYSKITETEFEYMFRGDDSKVTIPLIHERVRVLHEVGEVLLNKYKGTFTECIESSGNDANKLVKLLFDEFETYRDEAVYEGLKVRFCNKARTLVYDIWTYYKRYEPKFELDTTNLMSTIFLNYRAPEVLWHYKIFDYSDKLMTRFKNSNEPLEHGSREELEIRGCSLFAIKKVCEEVWKISRHYTEAIPILNTEHFKVPILVDNYLFVSLVEIFDKDCEEQKPFHYIKTVHY